MITPDEDVDGEMLCICRISIPTGYEVINRSRCDWEYVGTEHFENQSIEFNDYVLFDAGVLEWIESGKWKAFV
ncbi:hypothetical protein [Saccharophagus degradans]|uniref:Uncharacterized protein n=1 Tax=Saccharophagus degradans TaxID=86304 RepID=A0AAW7X8L9_9GAMM|nr:hypothetical protein [Saccharophagus degradans]MDO6423834.1 hypothetical protein [Saccharophagus degradans]MDO6607914.1 hypothetical protein [Saccharophagus degradans]